MDFLTLIIGIVIGIVFGFSIAWVWASANAKAKGIATTATEAELKALLAEQANEHLRRGSESIERITDELEALKSSMIQYEQSLSTPLQDESRSSFFGEHAGLFLRNTKPVVGKSSKHEYTEDQPRDFSSGASGLFVGHPDAVKLRVEEKSNN